VVQGRISDFWESHKAVLQQQLPGMSLEDLKYARSLVRRVNISYIQNRVPVGQLGAGQWVAVGVLPQ
jgi:hypothetical protein